MSPSQVAQIAIRALQPTKAVSDLAIRRQEDLLQTRAAAKCIFSDIRTVARVHDENGHVACKGIGLVRRGRDGDIHVVRIERCVAKR